MVCQTLRMSAMVLRAGARFGRRGGRFVGLLACAALCATVLLDRKSVV